MSEAAPPLYERFRRRAAALLDGGADIGGLLQRALARLERVGGRRIGLVRDDLETGIALIRAWYAGEYRQIDQSSVVRMLGAVLYFVVPLDALPDFIVGLGLLDDAAVIAYVVAGLRSELDAFRTWRNAHAAAASGVDTPVTGADGAAPCEGHGGS